MYIDVEIVYRSDTGRFCASIKGFYWPFQLGVPMPVGYGDTIQAAFDDLKGKV